VRGGDGAPAVAAAAVDTAAAAAAAAAAASARENFTLDAPAKDVLDDRLKDLLCKDNRERFRLVSLDNSHPKLLPVFRVFARQSEPTRA